MFCFKLDHALEKRNARTHTAGARETATREKRDTHGEGGWEGRREGGKRGTGPCARWVSMSAYHMIRAWHRANTPTPAAPVFASLFFVFLVSLRALRSMYFYAVLAIYIYIYTRSIWQYIYIYIHKHARFSPSEAFRHDGVTQEKKTMKFCAAENKTKGLRTRRWHFEAYTAHKSERRGITTSVRTSVYICIYIPLCCFSPSVCDEITRPGSSINDLFFKCTVVFDWRTKGSPSWPGNSKLPC